MRTRHALLFAAALILGACGADSPTDANGSPTTVASPGASTTSTAATEVDPNPTTTASPTTTVVPAVDPAPIVFPTGVKPVRIEVPALGVDAPVIDLNLSGPEPEVPTNFDDTGWYEQTRLPGEIGPAVIAGHIDSRTGPAVFYKLDELVAGDQVIVHGADGDSRIFEVVNSAQYPKEGLPPEVFGFGEPTPELRLITCGGTFDANSGHYRDNLVVYTRLAGEAG